MSSSVNKPSIITLTCDHCGAIFQRKGATYRQQIKRGTTAQYCSRNCYTKAKTDPPVSLTCENCGESFVRSACKTKRTKNHFCSSACWSKSELLKRNGKSSIDILNKISKFGRRSKLEKWIEEKLRQRFPKLGIKPCDRQTLNGLEFDLYFPELSLAIEFNGIFHYKPIYGLQRLEEAQKNDKMKVKLCIEKEIDLWVIDTSTYINFKPKTAEKFLETCEHAITIAKSKSSLSS